jgi:hypothetical protein
MDGRSPLKLRAARDTLGTREVSFSIRFGPSARREKETRKAECTSRKPTRSIKTNGASNRQRPRGLGGPVAREISTHRGGC